MKTEFFLKQDHYRVSSLVYSYALIAAIFAYGEYCMRDYFFAALLIFHTVFSGVLLFFMCKWGLYIQQGQVYYKAWRECSIDVQEIVGIKIMQEYVKAAYGYSPVTDLRGNPLFSITLLRSLDGEMYTFDENDVYFRQKFRRDVICYAVYDKEAVEYLLYLNPNIEIIL